MVAASKPVPRAATTRTTPRLATSTPPITLGRNGSRPSTTAITATMVGIEARMSALFDAVVRSSPEIQASW